MNISSRSVRLSLLAALLLFGGCGTPNFLSHTQDYHGSRQSKTVYQYQIRHRQVRTPVYLIAGAAVGAAGITASVLNADFASGETTILNASYALAGVGLGVYAITAWAYQDDDEVPFDENGEFPYFDNAGAFLGMAKIKGDVITFPEKPEPEVEIELRKGERITLDLKGRYTE
jgi:hypothetical protein